MIETNFIPVDKPLGFDLSLNVIGLDLDYHYPIYSIIDRIFDTKWKKRARKIFAKQYELDPTPSSSRYEYHFRDQSFEDKE